LIEGSGAAASRRAIVAAGLGMPGFASPPDQFPDLVATARLRRSATSSPSRRAHPIRGASPTSSIPFLASLGVSRDRLQAEGHGFDTPLSGTRPQDPANRRVEIVKK
jgi:hypothetical protein